MQFLLVGSSHSISEVAPFILSFTNVPLNLHCPFTVGGTRGTFM